MTDFKIVYCSKWNNAERGWIIEDYAICQVKLIVFHHCLNQKTYWLYLENKLKDEKYDTVIIFSVQNKNTMMDNKIGSLIGMNYTKEFFLDFKLKYIIM